MVLPYENAQAWYDGKRAYHGRKAKEYYGKTRAELAHALNDGLNIKGELRFWVENERDQPAGPRGRDYEQIQISATFPSRYGTADWTRPLRLSNSYTRGGRNHVI